MASQHHQVRKKSIVYIDGYNWYHAIFKHHPEWKWLNIQSFFEGLRPDEEITAVKLFSAMVDPNQKGSPARERQQKYFDALKTLPKVKIVLGAFQERQVTCRADCAKTYMIQDEKKTDVNLAIEIIDDALNNACEKMYIVSGDSDVQPAVEWVWKNRPQTSIMVYVPALKNEQAFRRTDYYRTRGLPVDCKFLPLGNFHEHQLKGAVKTQSGFAIRPNTWKKPD